MKNNFFIRTGYNFFNSILKIEDIIKFAKDNDLKQICIIEKDYLYSSLEFINQALKNNLIPIIGLKIKDNVFISKNYQGYKSLIELSSFLNSNKEIKMENYINNKNIFYFKDINFKYASFLNKEDLNTYEIFKKISPTSVTNEIAISLEDDSTIFEQKQLNIFEELLKINFNFEKEVFNYKETLNFYQDPSLKLKKLLETNFKNFIKTKKIKQIDIYKDRLQKEFDVINSMNFSSYFLIVFDYINWAIENNISIGPGRGSAPGSLISFLLNISKIDPVENNLLFERFLNKDRISIPDIDIDFQDDRREEVINYLISKYGMDHVSQISAFQTFQIKNSIKDISRIYGLEFKEVNNFTKMFFDKLSLKQNLSKKEIKEFIIKNPVFNEIIEHVKKIIDLPRQISTHAAGILISSIPIYKIVPVFKNNLMTQTQLEMKYLEQEGLIKFDFLGLKNISILKNIFSLINRNQNQKLDLIIDIDQLSDKNVFELLTQGKTLGIFQFESKGMKETLKKIKINTFEDIVSVISLFRPGPQKNIDLFAKNKHNPQDITYLNPILKDILKNTYGIIVYQEQIMEIVSKYANFTLLEADSLRRAISKKDTNEMEILKEKFLKQSNDYEEAKKLFDLIYEFSNYGFNRSHAFSYSIISYNFAWLKYYYPLEFALSYLISVDKDKTKIKEFLKENPNLKIHSIDFFKSQKSFSLIQNDLIIGFNSINGFGPEIINKIFTVKEKHNFVNDIYELIIILNGNGLSKKNIEDLIKVGAFDSYGFTREGLLDSLESILKLTKIIFEGDVVNFSLIDKEDLPIIKNIQDVNNLEYEKKLLDI